MACHARLLLGSRPQEQRLRKLRGSHEKKECLKLFLERRGGFLACLELVFLRHGFQSIDAAREGGSRMTLESLLPIHVAAKLGDVQYLGAFGKC